MFRDPLAAMRRMYATYGELVALRRGDPTYVFAFGPEHNRSILSNPELFKNGAGPFFRFAKGTPMERLLLNNLAVMNGPHHRQQRRLMQPAFHKQRIQGYRDAMVALTTQTLERWQPGQQVDVLPEFKRLTRHIAVKTLFGLDQSDELEQAGELLQATVRATSSPLLFILPFDLPGLPYHQMSRAVGQLDAYVRRLVAVRRGQPEGNDLLATLTHVRDEDGTSLSDDELVGHTFTLFVAGHETTTNALAWATFLLAQHPRVNADLVDELDRALHGEPPSPEQLSSLPLLDGVVKETLRLMPPAAVGLRETTASCELGGYALPEKATVFYSEFVTHRMPALYSEPDRFKPERWAALSPSTYEYLPFAAGSHRCIGAEFAVQEMKVVLAMLVQRYRLSIVEDAVIEADFGMRPARGIPVRVHPQDRRFARSRVRGRIGELVDFSE
jgi:cytochrome P450